MLELAPYLPGFAAAYTILLVASLSPGPSVAMLIGVATTQGRSPALVATLGIALGSMTLNVLTLLGVGLILSKAAWAMTSLRLVGAAYLLYLALVAFRKAFAPPAVGQLHPDAQHLVKLLASGYLLQVTNPKAVAFWLAIASIGAVDAAPQGIVMLFIGGAFIISFVCHGAWAIALSARPVRAAFNAWRRWVEASLGCVLAFFAWKLATTER